MLVYLATLFFQVLFPGAMLLWGAYWVGKWLMGTVRDFREANAWIAEVNRNINETS